jgi:hypothetical protein
MASIIKNYKKIQRVSSVILRAAERCLHEVDVTQVRSVFTNDEYILQISMVFFEHEAIDITIIHKNANECIKLFISQITGSIDILIDKLKCEEERNKGIEEYDSAILDADNTLIFLSSALMFKQIIKSINTK